MLQVPVGLDLHGGVTKHC